MSEKISQQNESQLPYREEGEDVISVDASASAQALHERIREGGFAISLSGGGHRATLATLGALIAIVDRGLSEKVIQVASVSGGSITNAFVAQRCRFEKLAPGELDDIATELATTVIRKGVLTRGWVALLLLVPVILGVVAGIILHVLIVPWTWLAIVIGVGVALAALIARGLVVEGLLNRRYFRHGTFNEGCRARGRARLASLSGRSLVDHVFCMTDLVLGLPVYASSQHGGFIYRRLELERILKTSFPIQTFDAGRLSIAELVRASAAFPGIPPRRLQIPPDQNNDLVAESPRLAFLADGGLWNNLGSHVVREDGFIGSHATRENGVIRPYSSAPKDLPLLCFNGSAPLRPTQPWAFKIPGIALIKSLLQTTQILNANTVLPRVDAMKNAFERRTCRGERPDHLDPADLLVDLGEIEDIVDDYRNSTWKPEFISECDPLVKKWERETLLRVRLAREGTEKNPENNDFDLDYVLGKQPEPQGSYPVCGLANIDDWDALRSSTAWKLLVEMEGTGSVNVPTTLGRIESKLARRLIARSYLNTYFVSLFLAPLADGDLDRLAKLPDRLDKIIGD